MSAAAVIEPLPGKIGLNGAVPGVRALRGGNGVRQQARCEVQFQHNCAGKRAQQGVGQPGQPVRPTMRRLVVVKPVGQGGMAVPGFDRQVAVPSTSRSTATPSRRRSRETTSISAGTALREASQIALLPAGISKR